MKNKVYVKDLTIGDRILVKDEGCLTIKKIEMDFENDKNTENYDNKSNITFEEGQVRQYKWKDYLTICGK